MYLSTKTSPLVANMAGIENLEYMELLRSSYPHAHDINRECIAYYMGSLNIDIEDPQLHGVEA